MATHVWLAVTGVLWAMLALAPPGVALGDKDDDLIIAHLEYLGYTCDGVEQGIRARHTSKIHLLLTRAHGGLLVQTGFPGKRDAVDDARYAVLNAVNARVRATRAFWTEEGHLLMSAWMPGVYDKTRFAAFMESWEQDTQTLRQFSRELKPYLAE